MTPPRLLLRKSELAEALGVSPSTVDRLERSGRIPPRRQLGAGARWLASEVEESLNRLPVGPRPDRTAAARAAKEIRDGRAAEAGTRNT